MRLIKAFLANRWLVFAVRLILGGCFLAASISKLQYPDYFTATVVAYGLLPDNLAHLYGLLVPWVELIVGCALVLGFFPVIVSWLSILLAYSFAFAGIFNLVYSNQSGCGCFGKLLPLSTPVALTVDIVLIILAVELLWQHAATGFCSVGALLHRNFTSGNARKYSFELVSYILILALVVIVIAIPLKTIHTQSALEYQIDATLEARKYPVLYFYSDSCATCKEFKPVIDRIERDYASKITVLRVDYDRSPQEVRKFEVTTTPTVLIIADKTPGGLYMMQRFSGKVDDIILRDSLPPIK